MFTNKHKLKKKKTQCCVTLTKKKMHIKIRMKAHSFMSPQKTKSEENLPIFAKAILKLPQLKPLSRHRLKFDSTTTQKTQEVNLKNFHFRIPF